MSVENGGEQPANDTTLANDTPAAPANDQQVQDTAAQDGEDTETEGEEGQQIEPEDEEVDFEGNKYRVPRTIRDALLRQADYTRKTQEVAEAKRALEAERENFGKSREGQRAHFEDAAKVFAVNSQLSELEGQISKYSVVDWMALSQSDPAAYQQHRAYYDSLKDRKGALIEQRDTAARTWTQKEQEYAEQANRERGERVAKVQAELPKLIEGWSSDLENKLADYGTAQGYSKKDLAEATLQNPKFAQMIHKAYLHDEQQKKQKAQQTFDKTQAAKPVTRVGANAGSSTRKTTDASGDALSTEEWAKRERERLEKQRPAMGRR